MILPKIILPSEIFYLVNIQSIFKGKGWGCQQPESPFLKKPISWLFPAEASGNVAISRRLPEAPVPRPLPFALPLSYLWLIPT